jgi:hypothetical protein
VNTNNTPIIDMGDVTDDQKKQTKRRHRTKASSESAPAPAPKPAPASAGGGGDLAGPVKVWK